MNILPAVIGPLTLDQLEKEMLFGGVDEGYLELEEYEGEVDAPSPFDDRTVEEL